MSNPFQLTFTLKQHTPLINFQWEQAGSTLRPTEFKTKLDRWIIAKGFSDATGRLAIANQDIQVKKWLKGKKENPALDYSISIQTIKNNSAADYIQERLENGKLKDADYKPFFGNQMDEAIKHEYSQDKKKMKRLSFYPAVFVQIYSAYEDLIERIKHELPTFLLHTNFGTRKSKGFGSFYIDTQDTLFPKTNGAVDEDFFNGQMMYGFDIKVKGNNDKERFISLFEIIDMFYKTLRSGISPSDKYKMYFKSLMWRYAKSQKRQWDKKTMKEAFLSSAIIFGQQSSYPDPGSPLNWNLGSKVNMPYSHSTPPSLKETHLLWRDILGLSSIEQWLKYNKSITKEGMDKENINQQKRPIYTRFPSPLFFKPLRTGQNSFRIYFEVPEHIRNSFKKPVSSDISEAEILGKWFQINNIQLPFPSDFDYEELLKEVAMSDIGSIVKTERVEKTNQQGRIYTEVYGKLIKMKKDSRWVEEVNPFYETLCHIFDQLAFQAENKYSKS